MDTEYDDDDMPGINQRNASQGAQVMMVESSKWAPIALVTSAIGAAAGIIALILVLTKLDDYHDSLAMERRLNTQAIDELRVEANVSRKLAGLPQVNYQEHD